MGPLETWIFSISAIASAGFSAFVLWPFIGPTRWQRPKPDDPLDWPTACSRRPYDWERDS